MYRRNLACFKCQYVTKGSLKCPFCQQETIDVGPRWRLPPRKKKKEWIKVLNIMKNYNAFWKERLKGVEIK